MIPIRSLALASVAASLAMVAPSQAGMPSDVSVQIDQARILRLDRPVANVVMGNPSIADVSLRDSQTAFIIGRTFGVTNFIALDSSGLEIANIRVAVSATGGSTVAVSRGAAQSSYNCSPKCELLLVPGEEPFKTLSEDIGTKIDVGISTAGAESGSEGE